MQKTKSGRTSKSDASRGSLADRPAAQLADNQSARHSQKSQKSRASQRSRKRLDDKQLSRESSQEATTQQGIRPAKPFEQDLRERAQIDYEAEELSDDELDIGRDAFGNSREAIFAELSKGSYFGALALAQGAQD